MSLAVFRSFYLAFSVIVFFAPWGIGFYYAILNVEPYVANPGWSMFHPLAWRKFRDVRKIDPHANYLHGKVKKWMLITLISWIAGFIAMGAVIYFFDPKIPVMQD